MYVFGNATQCSRADKPDFANVIVVQDKSPRIQYSKGIDRNVAWSFYSLNSEANDPLDKYFQDENNQVLIHNFIFPILTEFERMKCLQSSIVQHYPKVSVKSDDAITQTKHHCQFTGGGDLIIEIKASLPSLVISEGTTSNEEENDFSPVHMGTSKSATLSIECKKDVCAHDTSFCEHGDCISNILCLQITILY